MESSLIIQNLSKHIELTDEEKEIFCSSLKIKKVKRHQFLGEAGEISRFQNFVTKGCLRSYYIDENGFEHNVQFAIEDWWIGDMASFLTKKPASLYIEALEDSEVLQIDSPTMEELYIKIPKLERFFRILLQNAFIALEQRIISVISKTAEERYLEFSNKYPQVEQRLPQIHIASYLGITPEFLSKLKKKILLDSSKNLKQAK
ncbi:MAG: Crp/Fnr family transcriptional regulator [Ignavibacteriaceae bacterium]|nr:Crp/Fnr family transcriptional regulator [Ignavibacteriaceae bacterium]